MTLRVMGGLIFVLGAAATGWAVRESFTRGKRLGALFGLLAPLALVAALTGALLVFVPDFF